MLRKPDRIKPAKSGSVKAEPVLTGLILTSLLFLNACGIASTPSVSSTTEPSITASVPPATDAVAMPSGAPATESPATPSPPPATRPTATPPTPPPLEGTGNADVLHVRAVEASGGTWTFHVTVEHPDSGWEDYADGWDVVTPDGEVLKPDPDSAFTRLLLHPHEGEQPFTRSQSRITIPPGTTQVRVRAHDLVDGYGGREVVVDLTAGSGPDFEVERAP